MLIENPRPAWSRIFRISKMPDAKDNKPDETYFRNADEDHGYADHGDDIP